VREAAGAQSLSSAYQRQCRSCRFYVKKLMGGEVLVRFLAALSLLVYSDSGPGVDLADVEYCFRRGEER
jgi:hypothetical protein